MSRIHIDAGHGNKDPGAVNGNRREADNNLQLALRVRDLLIARGHEVSMTRTTNNFTIGRVQAARNANADCYISCHRNGAESETAHGYEAVIKMNPSARDVDLANAITRHIVAAGVQRVRETPLRGVNRANGRRDLEDLAATPANMASVAVELGFISNARDNQLFDTKFEEYARAIVRGICDIYGAPIPELTANDALIVLRAAVGIAPLTAVQRRNYGIKSDSEITAGLALKILQAAVGVTAVMQTAN
jgi:N-acetylmuramoyl-L-alanine amidase